MLKIYNSLNRKKEEFKPIDPPEVKMYNCGPTVYNYAHIGNLRSFISADIFRRTLEYNGYKVKQIINITDVGHLTGDSDEGKDKVETEAKKKKKSVEEIIKFYTEAFFRDIERLNIKIKGTKFPRATNHIKEQVDLIRKMEDKGYTYKTSDGIYFNTTKIPNYDSFKIMGESLKHGARISINSEKHDHHDFALWKFSNEKEKRQQEWDSPWGVGFPGWHLECSAMAMKYLGESFDIHTGGIDNKFPHHTNEIAQSETVTEVKFSKYWLHTEFVSVKGGKMAKSEGNFITMEDVIDRKIDPLSYKYWILGSHYRSPVKFSWEALKGADTAYRKLKEMAILLKEEKGIKPDPEIIEKFKGYINDDFDTPKTIALIWKMMRSKKIKQSVKRKTLLEIDDVLGLSIFKTPKEKKIPKKISTLAQKREEARKAKKWKEADEIREELKSLGYSIEDTSSGPKLEKIR